MYLMTSSQQVHWLLDNRDTCVEQPRCCIGVQAKLGRIHCGSLGGALEESNLGVAVVHKALADAAIGGHVIADMSQLIWKHILLHAMTKYPKLMSTADQVHAVV